VDRRIQVQLEEDGDCSTEQSSKMGTNGVCGLCSTASDKDYSTKLSSLLICMSTSFAVFTSSAEYTLLC